MEELLSKFYTALVFALPLIFGWVIWSINKISQQYVLNTTFMDEKHNVKDLVSKLDNKIEILSIKIEHLDSKLKEHHKNDEHHK